MPVGESIVVGIFTMAVVFVVLFVLYAIVLLLSKVLAAKTNKKPEVTNSHTLATATGDDDGAEIVQISSGELRLKNVDEKTAAMIMAIVSHESEIPLSELRFKSISLVE